jgi:hypothetical protein
VIFGFLASDSRLGTSSWLSFDKTPVGIEGFTGPSKLFKEVIVSFSGA